MLKKYALPLALVLACSAAGADTGSSTTTLTPEQMLQQAWSAADYATVLLYTRPMANRGDAKAQFDMGRLYLSGNGVEQSYGTAVVWLRQSATQGYAPAQDYLRVLCTRRPDICQ